MGAIELQVFVSLVVILGAAFVALICDFLKGSNEQLRESNIELKVRQDERDKRDALVQEVQRQTIEVVTQIQRVAGQRPPAPGPAGAAAPQAKAEPSRVQPVSPVKDARTLFEEAERARQGRGRRDRRNAGPATDRQTVGEPQSAAAWAQEVYLRRFPHGESKRETPAEAAKPEPAVAANQEDIRAVLERVKSGPTTSQERSEPVAEKPAPAVDLTAPTEPVEKLPGMAGQAELSVKPVQWKGQMGAGGGPVMQAVETGMPAVQAEARALAPAEAGRVEIAQAPVRSSSQAMPRETGGFEVAGASHIPCAGLETEGPVAALEPPAAEAVRFGSEAEPAETDPNVVRIRVLREEEVVENVVADAVPPVEAPVEAKETAAASSEAAGDAADEAGDAGVVTEDLEFELEPQPAPRSNVVEMPTGSAARGQEPVPQAKAELAVPGGYHEPQALARLMEEEAAFRGLAMVVSLVDYVKLLADQGKPAMEQLMGSVSRLVVSMTREQDFACRISEDEFVLLFVNEIGASANRRIQTVSERLWDFQLRSLGSMSLMFTWGAAESMNEPLTQVLERAREQMIETRRGRRSLSGAGRFRWAAND